MSAQKMPSRQKFLYLMAVVFCGGAVIYALWGLIGWLTKMSPVSISRWFIMFPIYINVAAIIGIWLLPILEKKYGRDYNNLVTGFVVTLVVGLFAILVANLVVDPFVSSVIGLVVSLIAGLVASLYLLAKRIIAHH